MFEQPRKMVEGFLFWQHSLALAVPGHIYDQGMSSTQKQSYLLISFVPLFIITVNQPVEILHWGEGTLGRYIVVNAGLIDVLYSSMLFVFFAYFRGCVSFPACKIYRTLQEKKTILCFVLIATVRFTRLWQTLDARWICARDWQMQKEKTRLMRGTRYWHSRFTCRVDNLLF